MKYIFEDGNPVGKLPINQLHICFYDGTVQKDGKCFDETFISPEDFDAKDLTYIETEEEKMEVDKDHSRVFVHMVNGDCYELVLKKVDKKNL